MSKKAVALLKALERCQREAQALYSSLQSSVSLAGAVDSCLLKQYIKQLDSYLEANKRAQMMVNAGYGEGTVQIARKTKMVEN